MGRGGDGEMGRFLYTDYPYTPHTFQTPPSLFKLPSPSRLITAQSSD
ncbi:MAG: hypothetical protein F6K36_16620 [Symploca sp. SIO3C6]|nr:hypothetical protein [Symploca sp. SIO3C6]